MAAMRRFEKKQENAFHNNKGARTANEVSILTNS